MWSQVVILAKHIPSTFFTIFRALYMQSIYTMYGKKFRPLHISSRTSLLELCNTNFSRFSLVKKCRVGHYWCWHNHLAEGWNCEIRTKKLQTYWSVCNWPFSIYLCTISICYFNDFLKDLNYHKLGLNLKYHNSNYLP